MRTQERRRTKPRGRGNDERAGATPAAEVPVGEGDFGPTGAGRGTAWRGAKCVVSYGVLGCALACSGAMEAAELDAGQRELDVADVGDDVGADVGVDGGNDAMEDVGADRVDASTDAGNDVSQLDGGPVEPRRLRVRVLDRHPHDSRAFTQGLLWHDGKIYESTGLNGRSSLRRVELTTGVVERRVALDAAYFGEGLARVGDRLFQLTWRSGKAFVYDIDTFERLGEFDYDTEGWGLCYDGEDLVMSDGTSTLFFRDPSDFSLRRQVQVRRFGEPLENLNELECVDGDVYANIWQTDEIVRIDPGSGVVLATIDASGLLNAEERIGADVLNGIAYLPESGNFLITGKLWPAAFEVVFEEP